MVGQVMCHKKVGNQWRMDVEKRGQAIYWDMHDGDVFCPTCGTGLLSNGTEQARCDVVAPEAVREQGLREALDSGEARLGLAEPVQYDHSVPPIEDVLMDLSAQVPDGEWARVAEQDAAADQLSVNAPQSAAQRSRAHVVGSLDPVLELGDCAEPDAE